MIVPIDEVVHFDFFTHHPTTAAVTDADSTPTFDVYEEATDTGLLGATNATKRTSLTGNYRGSFTASAANGFEAGKWYNVNASATVNAIAGKGRVMHFRCGPAESAAGVPKADVSHYGGTAGTFASGRPEVNTTHAAGTAWGSGAITAASIAADAITEAKVASDVTIASVTGAVGSVTGNVGSVTGNVGGNVTGSVGSVATGGIAAASFAAGAIDAAAIAANAIGASELAADAVTEIAAAITVPTAAAIADAVWDEATSGHTTSGTFGEQVKTDIDDILTDTGTTLQGELDGIQADTEDIQTRLPAALVGGRIDATVDATGMESGAIDAILDDTIGDGTLTMRQALRVLIAGMAGKLSGAATTTITIRNVADSADVIVATVTADGNRTAVTVTP